MTDVLVRMADIVDDLSEENNVCPHDVTSVLVAAMEEIEGLRGKCETGSELLENYLQARGLKKGFFASQIGISAVYLSHFLSGRRKPNADICARIDHMTNGDVPASSWV